MGNGHEETKSLGVPDMFIFERRLREVLHELNLKRALLNECRRDLGEAVLAQHELERALDRERCDGRETRLQLELAMGAARRCEEEKTSVMEGLSRQRVQLEVATKEREALRDQARAVQLENVDLRRKVEEQEGQLRCQVAFQQSSSSHQSKIREIMKEVHSQMQKLEQDHRYLERTVEAVQSLSSRLQMGAKHYSCMREKDGKQIAALEQTVVTLAAELDKLELELKKGTTNLDHDEFKFYNSESLVSELRARLEAECEGSGRLSAALDGALKAVALAQGQEAVSGQELARERERAAGLQLQLEATQQALQDERELHKKAECKETGMQTDDVLEGESESKYNFCTTSDTAKSPDLDSSPQKSCETVLMETEV